MISDMLASGAMTRTELNARLAELSVKPEDSLQQEGYNKEQIDVIKNYDVTDDAYNHVFANMAGATLTFEYGLAGQNTRKDILIAYDMEWSTCPMFTFTDSFGIGWIAANEDSVEVVTKTDSSNAQVQYYTVDGQNAGLYRDVDMDTQDNSVVIGTPIIGSAQGNYGKHIGGVTQISSQSDSYSIETIQLFVAYSHTTLSIVYDWEAALEWEKVSAAIKFIPSRKANIMVEDNHTFKYDDQDVITG